MLKLTEVQACLQKAGLLKEIWQDHTCHFSQVQEEEYQAIQYDSRKVTTDSLFICKGQNFKVEFLEMAQEKGALAYLSEKYETAIAGLTAIVVTDIRKAMAVVAQAFYGHPEKDLKIIAYTGTKGKTTSAYFCYTILSKTTSGRCALLSTMETILDGKTAQKSQLTTPESLDLFRMFREAVDYGMTHLVMEVSSQAYKLNRVYGLHFDVGVFVNLSPDHIGPVEHPSFEDYMYCKSELIEHTDVFVLENEIKERDFLLEKAKACHVPVITYGWSKTADYVCEDLGQAQFQVRGNGEDPSLDGKYQIQLLGDFNELNALSALIACQQVGAQQPALKEGLAETVVPGRMECLKTAGYPIVYIDYAHNYLSASALLSFIQAEYPGRQIYVVVGSTGNKAQSRRKDFGRVLSEYADVAILTSDDPQYEDPKDIMAEIRAAMTKEIPCYEIVDREEAVKFALHEAKESAIVVLMGKGRDAFQHINGKDEPYAGDVNIAKNYLGIESE